MAMGNWASQLSAFPCPVRGPALRCSRALVFAFRSAMLWGSTRSLGLQSAGRQCCHLLSKEVPKALRLGQGCAWLPPCLGHPQAVPPCVCSSPWATAMRLTGASYLFATWEGCLLLGGREKEDDPW